MSPDVLTRLTAALSDRYRLERELGAGGMATVYLAHDLRHDRRVALKLLRPELAAVIGAERFLAEIKVTANLQHPHILPLFDSGECDGLLFYVMPYVEGESLRTKLEREKQLGVEEAVRLTTEVASALDYAHRHGVVHRDIKPENVLLHDGTALVADFGIALAATQAGATRMTATGMSLGTPAYMSPEQAMGDREVDARSDIYALGAMLYEMLVGDPPYVASTAQAVVAKVLTEKPVPVTVHRDTVPANVAAAVQKALAKLPADRFASAAEFIRALSNATWSSGELPATQVLPAAMAQGRRRRGQGTLMLAAGLAAGALLGAVAAWRLRPVEQTRSRPVVQFGLQLPADAQPVGRAGSTIAYAPDGSKIVYLGGKNSAPVLYVRHLDKAVPVAIPGTENAIQPFFSPDGQWIAFFQAGKLAKLPLAGGPVSTICSLRGFPFGAAWASGDTIVIAVDTAILEVPASGGTPRVVARAATGERWRFPDVVGGRGVVFGNLAREDTTANAAASLRLAVLDRRTGKVKRLSQAGGYPRWVDGGRLVMTDPAGMVLSARFDPDRLEVAGGAEPMMDGFSISADGDFNFGVSRGGDVAYQPVVDVSSQVVLTDASGVIRDTLTPVGSFYAPVFSPDGRRVALLRARAADFGVRDIWVRDIVQRTLTRITFDSVGAWMRWSHDGRELAYSRFVEGTGAFSAPIYAVPVDGSAQPRLLPVQSGQWVPVDYDPAIHRLLYAGRPEPGAKQQIWRVRTDSGAVPEPVLVTPFDNAGASLSPDGAWLAYVSNESGRDEVYVRPASGTGGRWQVSLDGGTEPVWTGDGKRIIHRSGNRVVAVDVRTSPAFDVTGRTPLFTGDFSSGGFRDHDFDVSADGRTFVFVKPIRGDGQGISVLLNWFDGGRGR